MYDNVGSSIMTLFRARASKVRLIVRYSACIFVLHLCLFAAKLAQFAEILLVPPAELEHRLCVSSADATNLLSAAAVAVCKHRLKSGT